MRKREWEKRFLNALRSLPKYEREEALEYYREMYGDKAESGIPEAEILREFGSPEVCAERILNEARPTRTKPPQREQRSFSVGEIVLFAVGFLVLGLPIACVVLSLLVAFGAVAVSGVAVSVAGVIYAIVSPLLMAGSLLTAGMFMHVGVGLTLCGVGALLCALFGHAVKYLAIGAKKLFQLFQERRPL